MTSKRKSRIRDQPASSTFKARSSAGELRTRPALHKERATIKPVPGYFSWGLHFISLDIFDK